MQYKDGEEGTHNCYGHQQQVVEGEEPKSK